LIDNNITEIKVIGRLFDTTGIKVVIKILQGSVVTQNRARWANYISSSCKFPIVYTILVLIANVINSLLFGHPV